MNNTIRGAPCIKKGVIYWVSLNMSRGEPVSGT